MNKENHFEQIRSGTCPLEYIEVALGIRLHNHDWEQGRPIILIHGWPLSNDMYNYQMTVLA